MSEVIGVKTVFTRKPHVCFGCARKFPANFFMTRECLIEDHSASTIYLCDTCRKIVSNFSYYTEFSSGDLREEAEELEKQPKHKKERR